MNFRKFVEWQERVKTRRPRAVWLVLPPVGFLAFIASPSYFLGPWFDATLGLPAIVPAPINLYIGTPILLAGAILFVWTTLLFVTIGQGTQTPLVPTQKLVTSGPFAYSRNPMVSGVILLITGLGILVNSIGFIVVGLVIPLAYLIFIKLAEEKELEARFDQEYVEYKKHTPFLIPTFRRPPSLPPPGS